MRKHILPLTALLFFSGLLFFSSCQKNKTEPNTSEMEQGYQFYPLKVGDYVVYHVDSIVWDDFLKAKIPSQCQLRYNVSDTFRTPSGDLGYVIDILFRRNSSQSYVPHNVMYAVVRNHQLVLTKNNLKFIKLTFPVKNGISWQGNAMIPKEQEEYKQYQGDAWDYEYSDFDQLYNTGMNQFPHTVTVNEIDASLNNPDKDSTAYAFKNYAKEVYAYGIGMIYNERTYWTFQPKSEDGQSGGSGYRKGYNVIMKAIDHN